MSHIKIQICRGSVATTYEPKYRAIREVQPAWELTDRRYVRRTWTL